MRREICIRQQGQERKIHKSIRLQKSNRIRQYEGGNYHEGVCLFVSNEGIFWGRSARKAIAAELGRFGKTVMLAYGGGSIKKSGVYDEMRSLLTEAGKEIVDFSGIMPNPTYAKVQEGAAL